MENLGQIFSSIFIFGKNRAGEAATFSKSLCPQSQKAYFHFAGFSRKTQQQN